MSQRLEQQTTRVTLRGIVGDYFASWYIMHYEALSVSVISYKYLFPEF